MLCYVMINRETLAKNEVVCCISDIDECAVNRGNCSELANCTNVPGSYSCTCITGYTGDGFTCTGELSRFIHVILQGVKLGAVCHETHN